jgi:tetratricopeptide (TPR) repeat protein
MEFANAAGSQSEDADIDDFTADAEGSFRAQSFTERGLSLFRSGDLQQALTNLDEAIKLCPTCSAPFRDMALVFDAQHKGAEAAEAADRAIALNPRSAAAFLVRGLNKARAGRFEPAVADYDEAIRLAPALGNAYRARANANTKLGRSAQAAADASLAAQLEQGGPAAAGNAPLIRDPRFEKALSAPALGEDALRKQFSAMSWQARQGPWLATLEFRADGTLRQHLRDTSEGSTLEVGWDGAWGISRGELCIYTNVGVCLSAHTANGDLVLARADKAGNRAAQEVSAAGTVEYLGALTAFKPLTANAIADAVAQFPVEEVLLPAASGANKGPKTLFYYMHGFDGHAREHSPLPEYFVSEFQESRGWDIIDGNYPRSGVAEIRRFGAANFGAAVFLARRLKELKAQGYQRIYVGGQSWGGWNSLILATMPGLPLDGVVLVVPACCGWRFTGADHEDPNYANNKIFFDQMIERVRYPTVGVFFLDDEYEPADRGNGAAAALTRNGVPNLIIDHPPGFSGHGSAWFPVFDYLYGDCIAGFLEAPRTAQCPARRIAMDVGDFRAILAATQLAKRHMNAATLAEVKGRQFAVYPQGELRAIVSADSTQVRGYGIGESLQSSSFQGDSYCMRARVKYNQPETTDEVCERLIKWSDDELLGLDPKSGEVLQWWVAHP